MSELEKFRLRIDEIDQKFLLLLSERAELAQRIGRQKKPVEMYQPQREAAILERMVKTNPGPLANAEIVDVYKAIISGCRGLETNLNVAFLGPEGTYSHSACLSHFGHSINATSMDSIEAVFEQVHGNQDFFGIVPIENSIEGSVSSTMKGLFEYDNVRILGEIELKIHHCLMSHATDLSSIKVILGHPQALGQCKEWLRKEVPQANLLPVSSTAQGAKDASQKPEYAAIASKVASEVYKLKVLATRLEDDSWNATRFLVIGRRSVPASGSDKTSLILSAYNEPGSLMTLMNPLVENGIDLSWLQSWPYRRIGIEYLFFIDCVGHQDEENLKDAFTKIRQRASHFRILGSYPRAATA